MFEYLSDILGFEEQQCRDEGRDISAYQGIIRGIQALPLSREREALARDVFEAIARVPDSEQMKNEPTEWAEIRACLPNAPEAKRPDLTPAEMTDRCLGAWLARAAGCLLGKPFEGRMRAEIYAYYGLEEDAYAPIGYFRAREEEPNEFLRNVKQLSIEKLNGMPVDDDTNYTYLALTLLEKYGRGFTSADWARHFVASLPPQETFTAERVAYPNPLELWDAPQTAMRHNPYREWIGAQIRTDLYGYVNPGDPLAAAEMANRDATVTHVRNGVYGAMWVSAAIANAYSMPAAQAIREALRVLPPRSRLRAALEEALEDFDGGMRWEDATRKLRKQWDEANRHHWCHVISNAVIVANAILYGKEDVGTTLSMAVLPGFDTDCNGATAGSILGASLGAKALPREWIGPMSDFLNVSLIGAQGQPFTELARRTVAFIR